MYVHRCIPISALFLTAKVCTENKYPMSTTDKKLWSSKRRNLIQLREWKPTTAHMMNVISNISDWRQTTEENCVDPLVHCEEQAKQSWDIISRGVTLGKAVSNKENLWASSGRTGDALLFVGLVWMLVMGCAHLVLKVYDLLILPYARVHKNITLKKVNEGSALQHSELSRGLAGILQRCASLSSNCST